MVNLMITSIFLLFVATGIMLASLIYGVGGIFPILVALSILVILGRLIGGVLGRRAPEAFTG